MVKKLFLLGVLCIFFQFQFPKDHSFHKNFALEWVYFVGILNAESGETFGYELSFFRVKLKDESQSELYPVHFAISDVKNRKHYTEQIIKRNIGGLSGFTESKLWSGEYEANILNQNEFHLNVQPKSQLISLDLHLKGNFGIFPQGKNGLSPKSHTNPAIYSYYYSYPRLESKGTIRIQDKIYKIVSGQSWLDHEWSEEDGKSKGSFTLSSKESGWDWVCISTETGSDFVFFRFREKVDKPHSIFGSMRTADGKIEYFHTPGQVQMQPKPKLWKSSDTNIEYPLEWKIEYPGGSWEISPYFNEQEFDGRKSTGIVYWEGLIQAKNPVEKTKGFGYLELKGYKKKKDWWEF